jgi:CDP-diacylglycerol---glycerol-3-phosphate 3-phosphatidyltransferase
MYKALDAIQKSVRTVMRAVAIGLNKITAGKLHPNVITLVGLIMHLPIAYLIATDKLIIAGILLVIFGLFDTIDGELARLQKRTSTTGMFLDSVTDRIKEVMLYVGAGYLFVSQDLPYFAVWAILACGIAVSVSYINAWGEVAISKSTHVNSSHQNNKSFRTGLMTYDVRIFIMIVGLLSDHLALAVIVIAMLSLVTMMQRIINVVQKLN